MNSPSGLTDADVTRILHLIDQLHDVEVRVEVEGMKLHVRKFSSAPPERVATTSTRSQDAPRATSVPGASSPPLLQQPPEETAPGPHLVAGGKESNARAIPAGALAIRAPMLGRFFRAPSPTEPPYVEVGSKVEPDDTVCMIEVMKLFNTVKAEVRGTIIEIAVENGDMVEHDSVLFLVNPL